MEWLIELIGEILIEGSFELATNKKINKWIRYLLFGILTFLFSLVILGIAYLAIRVWKESVSIALILFGIDLFLIVASFKRIQKEIKKKIKLK